MKRLIPVLGLALLIVLLIFVNRGISKTAQPDTDDDAPQTSAKADPKPAATAPTAQTTNGLDPEITVGDPTRAKHRITVGWVYDEANQGSTAALASALQVVRQVAQASKGTISAEIVDLDVPQTELSPLAGTVSDVGVFVDGTRIGPADNPGAPGLNAGVIAQAIPR